MPTSPPQMSSSFAKRRTCFVAIAVALLFVIP